MRYDCSRKEKLKFLPFYDCPVAHGQLSFTKLVRNCLVSTRQPVASVSMEPLANKSFRWNCRIPSASNHESKAAAALYSSVRSQASRLVPSTAFTLRHTLASAGKSLRSLIVSWQQWAEVQRSACQPSDQLGGKDTEQTEAAPEQKAVTSGRGRLT